MTPDDALRAVRYRLMEFIGSRWYGDINIKIEAGQIRHVEARPIMRDTVATERQKLTS